jgi:peptidoglycan/xylan/chitin deacetylase (PgdA/CDA1 family)
MMFGSAGARLARRVRRHAPRGVVLCYHRIARPQLDPAQLDVAAARFDEQLRVLRAQAHPMALPDFERARRVGHLPERAVAVSFDDGYADNLHTALPLLETHAVPATVFVTTGGIGSTEEFWWDALERVCYAPRALPAKLVVGGGDHTFQRELDESARSSSNLAADGPRWGLYRALSLWLRVRPASVQREVIAQLQAWSGTPAMARESHRAMTVEELQRLAQSPLIEIGAHSVTHPTLGLLAPEGQRLECERSRGALAAWLGKPPALFAYPFGEGAGVTRGAERVVAASGFAAAYTTDARAAWRWDRATAIPRFAVQGWGADEFARRLEEWFKA